MESNVENRENEFAMNRSPDAEGLPEDPSQEKVADAFQPSEGESEPPEMRSKSIFDEWSEERAFADEPSHPVKLKLSTVVLLMAVMALEFVWGVMPYVASGMIGSSPLASRREIGEGDVLRRINITESLASIDPTDVDEASGNVGVILTDENKLRLADSFRLTSLNDGVTGITEEESGKEETDSTNKENTEDDSKSESVNATIVTPPLNITIVGNGSSFGVVEGAVTTPGGAGAGDYSDKHAGSPSDSYVVTITPSIEYTEVKVENIEAIVIDQSPDTAFLGFYGSPLSALGNPATIRLICLLKLITGLKVKESEVDDGEEENEEYAA